MINIEKYIPKYHQQVIDLVTSIQQHEFNIPIKYEDQPDLQNILEFYGKGKSNFWIACDNGKLVGTIGLIDIGDDTVVLRKMFVHKDYRGDINVATNLLKILEDYSILNGIDKIYLGTTDIFKAAHKFYEKHNYKAISKDNLPDNFPLMAVDTRFYLKMI